MSVRIITDSAADMDTELAESLGVQMIHMRVRFGEEEFLDGLTISHEQFYERLIESDDLPSTSLISPYEFSEVFEGVPKEDEAVCITLSSKLSGTHNSARIAAEDFDNIHVVDSENACIGQHILVLRAVRLRDQGLSAKEIAETLEVEKKQIRLIALLDTLEYLKKGGRISSSVALVGNILNIKPVVDVEEGEVILLGKARGSKNGNNYLNEEISKNGGIDFTRPITLGYSGLNDDLLQKYIKDSASVYEGYVESDKLPIASIGSIIGTHVGPGVVAVAFFVKE